MRKVNVYYGETYAGQLVELSKGSYEFTYDDTFLSDSSTPPVSVNMPKSKKVYHADKMKRAYKRVIVERLMRYVRKSE